MSGESREIAPTFSLLLRQSAPVGFSPYRLVGGEGGEVEEINEFLDSQVARGLSACSVRAYGYALLSFWRWLAPKALRLEDLRESDLLDYIRFLMAEGTAAGKPVAPRTVNHRLTAARCLYRFRFGVELPRGRHGFPTRLHRYHSEVASEKGYLHPARPPALQLRVREPREIIRPLSSEEVHSFIRGFRTWRDLSIVALMLLCGLRSREVIAAKLCDVSLLQGEMRVRGKGGKERFVPLPPQVVPLLGSYLSIERPAAAVEDLFVVLKGPSRGRPLTPAGLRSLFRHHRCTAAVPTANPHRFRHTFGSDMARAGISLPTLMKLMGHGDIHTTMVYVEISPRDVWEEFHRVLRACPPIHLPGS